MKYGNHSLWKRLFYSPLSIGIAIILLVLIVRGGIHIHEKAVLAQERLAQAQAQLSDIQKQKEELTASINQLSTPAGMEAELRQKYHAVKEGESVAVIVPTTSTDASTSDEMATTTKQVSWWGHLLQFVGF